MEHKPMARKLFSLAMIGIERLKNMRHKAITSHIIAFACLLGAGNATAQENQRKENSIMEEKLNLTQEWDKVFPQSEKVKHCKVTFHNRYGITLAASGQ